MSRPTWQDDSDVSGGTLQEKEEVERELMRRGLLNPA
jgi:hypothetical protein